MTGELDGNDIYYNFQTGEGSNGVQQVAHEVSKMSSKYGLRAHSIKSLQERMQGSWTGGGGDAAAAGAGPLMPALEESAGFLDQTSDSNAQQAQVFHHAKDNVVPVPDAPEAPNPWASGAKALIPIAGPFMAADDVKSYQNGMAAHNEAAQRNVTVMSDYESASTSNSNVPNAYGRMQSDGTSVSLAKPAPPAGAAGSLISLPGVNGPGVGTPDRTASSSVGPAPTAAVPSVNGPAPAGPSAVSPGAVTGAGSVPPGPNPAPPPGAPPPTPTGGPTTSGPGAGGLVNGMPPGGANPDRNTTTGRGRPAPTGNGNRAGDRLRGLENSRGGGTTGRTGGEAGAKGAAGRVGGESLSGRGGEAGARGGAGSAGSNSGSGSNALGAGKGSGAGMPGAAGATEAAAARGGAAGGRGGAGMGAMGAGGGGGRGKGNEDEEHQRADFLVEPDPDAIFGTDERATAPVIGESRSQQ